MLEQIYAIFDTKTNHYAPPFASLNDDVAKRVMYLTASNNPVMELNPGDFKCYRIGTFDSESGELEGSPPLYICSMEDLLERKE